MTSPDQPNSAASPRKIGRSPFGAGARPVAGSAHRVVENEAEGVADGVEVDPEGCAGLVPGFGRAERDHGILGDIEVEHMHVHVRLLRTGGARPRRRHVVVDPLEGKGRTVVDELDPVVVTVVVIANRQTRKRAVERGEGAMVGAVDRQHGKASNSRHRRNVAITRPLTLEFRYAKMPMAGSGRVVQTIEKGFAGTLIGVAPAKANQVEVGCWSVGVRLWMCPDGQPDAR